MNDVVRYEHHLPESAATIRSQVNRIQEVMQAVMKQDVHYGKIPGTDKPSLWKPGAEVLCATFHIAVSYRTEDLSGADFVRYRVTCVGTHQASGTVMGEGLGECSSLEEKYKWRRTFSQKEFDATSADRRRVKYGKGQNGEYEIMQVRTEAADLANTILKMACKRAQVGMTLNVVAASDIFSQDLEDLPEGLQAEGEPRRATVKKPQAKGKATEAKPKQATTTAPATNSAPAGDGKLSEGQMRILKAKIEGAKITDEQFKEKFGCLPLELPGARFNDAAAWIREMVEAKQ